MDALAALRTKRDTRAYSPDPIGLDVLERVVGAARMAGSAKNVQPVRLIVVSDQEVKEGLTKAGDFASWIGQATLVVVATVPESAGPRRLFDVGRHLQNLMLAAHAEGLASCPVTIHHTEVARNLLGIPAHVEPAMIVTLGWPAPGGGAPASIAGPRLSVGDYAFAEKWDAATE